MTTSFYFNPLQYFNDNYWYYDKKKLIRVY